MDIAELRKLAERTREAAAKICDDLAAEQVEDMAFYNDERHGVYAKKYRKAAGAIRAMELPLAKNA